MYGAHEYNNKKLQVLKMPENITNGTIEEIFRENYTTFVTVSYWEGQGNRRRKQRIRMLVRPRTVILDSNGRPVPISALRVGMVINATVSSAMTRSIPPQANAYSIRIVRRGMPDNVVTGRILEIDRNNRSFTTISDLDFSSIIRFNVSDNTRFLDRAGRNTNFARLNQGMLVRVRHADFMTASIPPQTTAVEVRIL